MCRVVLYDAKQLNLNTTPVTVDVSGHIYQYEHRNMQAMLPYDEHTYPLVHLKGPESRSLEHCRVPQDNVSPLESL